MPQLRDRLGKPLKDAGLPAIASVEYAGERAEGRPRRPRCGGGRAPRSRANLRALRWRRILDYHLPRVRDEETYFPIGGPGTRHRPGPKEKQP
jgi:hypothetical protein